MKSKYFIAFLFLLSSCISEESPFCHKNVRIANNSEIPLRVYRIDGYVSQDTTYAFRRNSPILYPRDTMLWIEAHYRDCLEYDLEWAQSHPNRINVNFETFYICDTNRPESVHHYSTRDSVLLDYNILKKVTLIDSNISTLQKKDFIITYP
ncbi:MAG: hypothetical protein II849_02825 [Bacteroidales bacterium]|nr:hypothetical protein [Bacteroidales bacterium]